MTHKTNIQKVTHLMNFGANPLIQPFVIEAIIRYAKDVMKSEPWPENYFIDFQAWKQCAEAALQELDPEALAAIQEVSNV